MGTTVQEELNGLREAAEAEMSCGSWNTRGSRAQSRKLAAVRALGVGWGLQVRLGCNQMYTLKKNVFMYLNSKVML